SSASSRRPTRARWRACRWSSARAGRRATRRSSPSRSTTSSRRSEDDGMRVLVVGAGGREHAIVRALKRSPQTPEVLATPGNPGIAQDAQTFDASVDDISAIADLVDELQTRGRTAFGPSRAAARLEGSKAFAKEVMAAANVPTAAWTPVDDVDAGMAAIDRYPVVLKFDGLAAGKGVVIAEDEPSAHVALHDFLVDQRFGPGSVVVEEHLVGEELSLLALCDGESAL